MPSFETRKSLGWNAVLPCDKHIRDSIAWHCFELSTFEQFYESGGCVYPVYRRMAFCVPLYGSGTLQLG